MEKLLVLAFCLLIGIVVTGLVRRPARGAAAVNEIARQDIAVWLLL